MRLLRRRHIFTISSILFSSLDQVCCISYSSSRVSGSDAVIWCTNRNPRHRTHQHHVRGYPSSVNLTSRMNSSCIQVWYLATNLRRYGTSTTFSPICAQQPRQKQIHHSSQHNPLQQCTVTQQPCTAVQKSDHAPSTGSSLSASRREIAVSSSCAPQHMHVIAMCAVHCRVCASLLTLWARILSASWRVGLIGACSRKQSPFASKKEARIEREEVDAEQSVPVR